MFFSVTSRRSSSFDALKIPRIFVLQAGRVPAKHRTVVKFQINMEPEKEALRRLLASLRGFYSELPCLFGREW